MLPLFVFFVLLIFTFMGAAAPAVLLGLANPYAVGPLGQLESRVVFFLCALFA